MILACTLWHCEAVAGGIEVLQIVHKPDKSNTAMELHDARMHWMMKTGVSTGHTQGWAWPHGAAERPLPCAGVPLLHCPRLCSLHHPPHPDLHRPSGLTQAQQA